MVFPLTVTVRSGPTFTKTGPRSQSMSGFGSGLGRRIVMTGVAFKGRETKASTTPTNAAPNIGIETPEQRAKFLALLSL